MGGLFEGDRSRVHLDSHLPWRISPEPFWITPEQHDFLLRLGPALLAFNRAANLLYHQSLKGIQPEFVHEYLDAGKPERILELSRLNRVKSHQPLVLRPDLIVTADGVRVAELDSIPGGIGFTAQVTALYADLGYDVIGGRDGLVEGFYEALDATVKADAPLVCIVVSDESDAYREEMAWIADTLSAQGKRVVCRHPRQLHMDDESILIEHESGEREKVDVVYRFFELFDLPNIPKVELVAYHAKKNAVRITPPMKAFLEEKMWLALFHHPQLQTFWEKELGDACELLQAIIPPSWIIDSRPAPPHMIIPGLQISGQPVSNWDQFLHLSKRQRELVIKPSGFHMDAQQSRGVTVGHDVPEEEWQQALMSARDGFENGPSILQEFHKGARLPFRYYDFNADEVKPMHGRVLLRPYYYVIGDDVRLAGSQCIACPADKKILHGMTDAVLVPTAVREPQPDPS
ncbi:MAG: hypothetical protein VYB08_02645 [Candidatus Latescibacterota bacterium]|nr:hypothetical protein [Candidatus Latescibacterota bacterium]